MASFESYLP